MMRTESTLTTMRDILINVHGAGETESRRLLLNPAYQRPLGAWDRGDVEKEYLRGLLEGNSFGLFAIELYNFHKPELHYKESVKTFYGAVVDGQHRLTFFKKFVPLSALGISKTDEANNPLPEDDEYRVNGPGTRWSDLSVAQQHHLLNSNVAVDMIHNADEREIRQAFISYQQGVSLTHPEMLHGLGGALVATCFDVVAKSPLFKSTAGKYSGKTSGAYTKDDMGYMDRVLRVAYLLSKDVGVDGKDWQDTKKDLMLKWAEDGYFNGLNSDPKKSADAQMALVKALKFANDVFKEANGGRSGYLNGDGRVHFMVLLLTRMKSKHPNLQPLQARSFLSWLTSQGNESQSDLVANGLPDNIAEKVYDYHNKEKGGSNTGNKMRAKETIVRVIFEWWHTLGPGVIENIATPSSDPRAYRPRVKLPKWEKQGRLCAECGIRIDFDEATGDHIYPHSIGGGTVPGNLDILCASCNGGKSDSVRAS
jgi:hypothetical protein